MNLSISTDKNQLDINLIISFLQQTYWGKDHTADQIRRSIQHSFPLDCIRTKNKSGLRAWYQTSLTSAGLQMFSFFLNFKRVAMVNIF